MTEDYRQDGAESTIKSLLSSQRATGGDSSDFDKVIAAIRKYGEDWNPDYEFDPPVPLFFHCLDRWAWVFGDALDALDVLNEHQEEPPGILATRAVLRFLCEDLDVMLKMARLTGPSDPVVRRDWVHGANHNNLQLVEGHEAQGGSSVQ